MTGLPDNWKQVRLADIADWTSGGTPSSTNPSFYGGNIPWVVIGDLTESVVETTEKSITQKGLNSSSAKVLPEGTVMLAMYGASIGRTGIMGKAMSTNQAIACAIPKSEVIATKYLLYYLQSQKQQFISSGKGGAQPNINQGMVKSWKIPVPPLNEQHKIIELLEDHISRLDAAMLDVKQATIKVSRFKVSLLRDVFKGNDCWKSIPLKSLGQWNGGGTPSKSNESFWTDGTIPWLSPKDMGSNQIYGTEDLITEEAALKSTVKKVAPNSVVLVVRSGILERKLPVAITMVEATLNQDMKAITFNNSVLPRFGYYAMLGFEQDILKNCRKSGTTVASINTESLMEYRLGIPDLETQQSIIDYVEHQIILLDSTSPSIMHAENIGQSLRRSLLQAAFTGQLTKEVISV